MAIALVSSVAAGSTNTDNVTTGAIDTTGASLLVVWLSEYSSASTAATISDSKGNTWTPLTLTSDGNVNGRYHYALSPTVGAGHTFTASGSFCFPSIAVAAFSGVAAASAFDVENGAIAASTIANCGSVTPTQNSELILAAVGLQVTNTVAVNNGFTITDQIDYLAGNHFLAGLAYLVQGAAAAVNAQWSWATASNGPARSATFKAAVVGGGGAADHLAMVTQPASGVTNVALPTQPVVEIRDATNIVVSTDTSTVTAALNVVSGSGTAIGTLTKAAVSGQAAFTDLGVNGTGTFTWTFTDGSLTSVTSAQFTTSARAPSPYLNLGTDGKDLGADISIIDAGTAVALSGDRRSVTEVRYGGASQWWQYGGVNRAQYPRTLIDSDMPTWAELSAMTQHSVSGDTALLALLGGGTLGTGGHVIIIDNTVKYTGDYRQVFPLRAGGDAIPGGTNVCILISKAYWDSMAANAGVCVIAPEKLRVTGPTNMANFECDVQLGKFMFNGATKGWRCVGLYFSAATSISQWSHAVGMGDGDAGAQNTANNNIPSNIILDRCYADAHAACDTIHVFEMNCAYGAVVDCAVGDHILVRYASESHVICGYNGPGPFRIVNNLTRGATQYVFFGGALSASGMPSDIEMRYNLGSCPDGWNPSAPDYAGVPRHRKNGNEVKAVKYFLAEYNVTRDLWYDEQIGAAWLLKVESYGNSATIGTTSDVIVRHNLVFNVSAGVNIAGVDNVEPGVAPQRVFFYNNLVRVGAPYFSAAVNPFAGLGSNENCGLIHNTFIDEGEVNVAVQFPGLYTSLTNLVIKDNLFGATNYGWKIDGSALTNLPTQAPGYEIDANAIVGGSVPPYPTGTYGPANDTVFVFEDTATADYALHGTTQGAVAGAASALGMVTQPSSTTETGLVQAVQPVVKVVDSAGLTVTSDTSTVTAALVTVTGTGTAIGTLTAAAVAGEAAFAGLGVTSAAGGTFKWRFTDGALTSVDSDVFTIVAPTQLAIPTDPTGIVTGVPFVFQVEVRDASNALVVDDTSSVTVARTTGAGVLSGTTTLSAVGGVATFTLTLTGVGTDVLTATSAGLTSAVSGTLTVADVPVVLPTSDTDTLLLHRMRKDRKSRR